MRAALEHEGYRVALAENGRQALEQQREQPAELLVTDIFMPDVDGIETIARFKSEFPSVRVIAMSAGGAARMQDYLRIAGYIGADAVLAKPFGVEELIRRCGACSEPFASFCGFLRTGPRRLRA